MLRKKFLFTVLVIALALGTMGRLLAQDDQSLLIWADAERAVLLTDLAPQVEADLGITLEIQEIGLGDARDQLLVAGPVGEGPDLVIVAHDTLGLLVSNSAIVPLDFAGMEDMLFPSALNLFTYQNQVWGLPYATENVALIRNVDLVPEAPTTWQQVRTISEELQAAGNQYGFIVHTGNTYHNFPITSAFGGYIFGRSEDGGFNVADIGLASEGGLAAAEWLSGMYRDGLMPTNVNDDVVFELFTSGDAAMFITGPWYSQRIIDTGINYAIDPIPGAEGGLEVGAPFSGGQGFVISAFSEKQLLAETFLYDFLATTEFMQAIFDQGGRPPAFVDVDTSANPNIAGFSAAGATAIPMPAIPEMGAVWAASDSALTLISQGEDATGSMEIAVAQIAEAINILQTGAVVSATVAGSLQEELGCPGDWQPECEATFMTDSGDGIWTATFTVPAGDYEYKVALNGGWAENYGAEGARDGANIVLSLAADTEVTFTFDYNTKLITDSVNNP
ncbi:MAG: extracellular solute-binding protein [Anaerolineae bacterium]|jgi:maltose/maltodextrin transport system substrate-binding protein/arabinogalactan oligomer/maltooligosaccharide transport system substrate-binding protein|nr:extracellular solute-binding protein [Anaerolineae bacterium]